MPMDDRDLAFDLLLALADYTLENGLPRTSLRIEAALDAFLEETGRASKEINRASMPRRKPRPRRTAQHGLPGARRATGRI
jgi:hypothetical protein